MSPRRPALAVLKKSSRRAAVALTTAALALGLSAMATGPARSATDDQCPSAFPLGDVTTGMDVHTLTVTHGTTPDSFNGKTLGVLKDGIAPGLDMILVDFGSPTPDLPSSLTEIDKAGIWEGMSGSPVYTSDGKLVGAVAYSLTWGISTIAGVTPAAEMQRMLTAVPAGTSNAAARAVRVPAALARRIVASGAASTAQVESGFQQLRVPFGISGVGLGNRRAQLAKGLGLRDAVPMQGGSASPDGAQTPIVAGGNLAASISYGDVTAAGIGTATAVCGDEVLAFGHPMNFSGTSTLTLHGAEAIAVQPGPNDASFKVANLGAPSGTIDQDHLAGLHGLLGDPPGTSTVTSYVAVGGASRTGTTRVSVPDAVPDIALANVVGDQDRVLDAVAGGSGTLSWRINLLTNTGTPLVLRRTDRFADPYDISYATVADLANVLYMLQAGDEGLTITSVGTRSTLSHQDVRYTLRGLQVRRHGAWHAVSQDRPLVLRAGSTARLRVVLGSKVAGPRTLRTDLRVPASAGNKMARLRIVGGNSLADQGDQTDVFEEDSGTELQPPSLDDVVQLLHSTPRRNDVVVEVSWRNPGPVARGAHRNTRVAADHVVDGSLGYRIAALRR